VQTVPNKVIDLTDSGLNKDSNLAIDFSGGASTVILPPDTEIPVALGGSGTVKLEGLKDDATEFTVSKQVTADGDLNIVFPPNAEKADFSHIVIRGKPGNFRVLKDLPGQSGARLLDVADYLPIETDLLEADVGAEATAYRVTAKTTLIREYAWLKLAGGSQFSGAIEIDYILGDYVDGPIITFDSDSVQAVSKASQKITYTQTGKSELEVLRRQVIVSAEIAAFTNALAWASSAEVAPTTTKFGFILEESDGNTLVVFDRVEADDPGSTNNSDDGFPVGAIIGIVIAAIVVIAVVVFLIIKFKGSGGGRSADNSSSVSSSSDFEDSSEDDDSSI
jgi:hypothetical protein